MIEVLLVLSVFCGVWTCPVAAQTLASSPAPASGLSSVIGRLLEGQAMWLWFVAALLGGLALNLTPCVYPMIPVTVAFFSGQAAGRVRDTAILGVLYVIGMSLTYALLGLVAVKTGALLGSWLQHPAVLVGMALLVTALALGMFGLYELQAPHWLLQRFGQASSGRLGALVMGLTVGIVASPCIGPFILGMLLFVSRLASPWLGFSLFFVMGVGMGLPYLLLGVLANQLPSWPKAGSWLVWIKKLFGMVLLGLALYFLKSFMTPALFRWCAAGGLALAGVYLGWLEGSRFQGRLVWLRRVVGAMLLGGAVALIPAGQGGQGSTASRVSVSWEPYSHARLEQATSQARPVIVDIYADWCLPCVELDHVTFRHPDVVGQLSTFVTLRVDATREVAPEAQEFLDRQEVYGVPTVLLFDANGRERQDLRINGFVKPDELMRKLQQVKRS